MSGPENYLKLFNLYTKNGNIWPENKLSGPEFRLLPEKWHPWLYFGYVGHQYKKI